MKKLTLFLTTTLTLVGLSIGKFSFSQNECPRTDQLDAENSSVHCWLKRKQIGALNYLQGYYVKSNREVWQNPEQLPTNIHLETLEKVSPADLQKWGLDETKTYYKGVTWTGAGLLKRWKLNDSNTSYSDMPKSVKLADLPKNEQDYIWITPGFQTQSFCQNCQGSLPNSRLPLTVIKRLRLIQYLGLSLNPPDYTHFVTIIAKESDIFRPCLETKIDDNQCEIFPESADKKQEIVSRIETEHKGLIMQKLPWTALGYTYDWGNHNNHVGASEYVIQPKATIYVESVQETCKFCGCE